MASVFDPSHIRFLSFFFNVIFFVYSILITFKFLLTFLIFFFTICIFICFTCSIPKYAFHLFWCVKFLHYISFKLFSAYILYFVIISTIFSPPFSSLSQLCSVVTGTHRPSMLNPVTLLFPICEIFISSLGRDTNCPPLDPQCLFRVYTDWYSKLDRRGYLPLSTIYRLQLL